MMNENRRVSRIVAGSLLLIVGTLFVLQNMGLVHAGRLGDYWPLLLVWFGLARVLAPRRSRHFASGFVILLLGIAFQLDRLGVFWLHARDFWPIFLVVAGVALIAESLIRRGNGARPLDGAYGPGPQGRA